MPFNTKLQEIRKCNELSQEGLAELLNVSRQSVSKWERGHGYPEIDKLIFISEHFNVSLDELLRDTQPLSSKRKTISLKKEMPVQEIYPQAVPQIKAASVNALSRPQGSTNGSNINIVRPLGTHHLRRKLSKKRLIILPLAAGVSLLICFFGIQFADSRSSGNSNYYVNNTPCDENYYEQISYTDEDSIQCLIDQETGTYYIFENGYQFIDYLYTEDLDQYIKLYDSRTDTYRYCLNDYVCDEYTFKYNGYTLIIPNYILSSSISAYDADSYTLMYNNAEVAFFVPNSIIPENVLVSNIDEKSQADEVTDISSEDDVLTDDDTDQITDEDDTDSASVNKNITNELTPLKNEQ